MFIEPTIESALSYLDKLHAETKPLWGSMSAQGMVEHLTDMLNMANGTAPDNALLIPAEKVESMQRFLESDKEMMRNIDVPFAPKIRKLRHEELELAVDEFVDAWMTFEEHFESNPGLKVNHPFYGELTYEQWIRLNQKHLTHHFSQFGLIS
jgi:oxepin-CoA hydrolase/3-oxo-5,6-dehydrosuberyl-CoA semialdehyde dehydrogenase